MFLIKHFCSRQELYCVYSGSLILKKILPQPVS
jgi:hypothetical protein